MALVHNPRISTSGLVFYVDAINPRSYPGSGTTWIDLTGNNNASLVNGPTFSNQGGGSITLDSVDDRVDCGTNFPSVISGTNSFAIECWIYPEGTQRSYSNIWGNHADNVTGIVCQQNVSNLNQYAWGWGNGSSWGTSGGSNVFNLNTQKWNHLIAARNGSNVITYLNGALIDTTSNSSNVALSPYNFQIGNGYNPSNPRLFNGKVASFKIYNQSLSITDALQNFNASRDRFGV